MIMSIARDSAALCLMVACVTGSCTTDEGCSLLGKCVNASCVCNTGWTGPACGRANLAPLDVSLGYQNATRASWGGRPIRDKSGRWHLIATEIDAKCPLILFQYNSQVIRAVSQGTDPGGPYSKAEVLFPPFHHNPTVVGPTPDGVYLSFFIGADNASDTIDCEAKVPNVPFHPAAAKQANGYITMAWTRDIANGPWEQRVVMRNNRPSDDQHSWHCVQNNPTAQVLPNGTIVLAFRANTCTKSPERVGVATAQNWSSEFVTSPSAVISPGLAPANTSSNNEDPFLWQLPDGSWHMLTHQQSNGNLCDKHSSDKKGSSSCGVHFFAREHTGPWMMSPEPAYSGAVTLSNGTQANFKTRQRPQLVFGEDNATPLYLFTGGSFEGDNGDLHMLTHTYAHAFDHT